MWRRFFTVLGGELSGRDDHGDLRVVGTAGIITGVVGGMLIMLPQLVQHATGRPLSAAPFLRYLERKYLAES